MKDVGWADVIIAVLLSPLLVLPVVGVVYVMLFWVIGLDSTSFEYWLSATFIAACVVEGLMFASLYRGPDPAIEYWWAWLLVVTAILAIAFVPCAAGVFSRETSFELASILYVDVAMIFLVVMLSIFVSTRRGWNVFEKRKIDLQSDTKTAMLKRL
ncbi:MAG: hypothetical protein JW880_04655 [Candidatus Thermoplasmatota archaeon]|nr:hypothetical protein [Candidatus Thermoplasmatota archaeon]